jgi:hypothetical protein
VLEEHNGSKLRAMQAKNKLYHPATIGADGQSVPGTVITDRHDGITILKELLEYLSGTGDSQDINEHMLYLQTMRVNPLPTNATEEQYAQRCERATEKHIFLPVNKQLAGRELSKFFVEQMPMVMTQRGQLLYEEELHATCDIFGDPDAVFQRCCGMMRHAYDPMHCSC